MRLSYAKCRIWLTSGSLIHQCSSVYSQLKFEALRTFLPRVRATRHYIQYLFELRGTGFGVNVMRLQKFVTVCSSTFSTSQRPRLLPSDVALM